MLHWYVETLLGSARGAVGPSQSLADANTMLAQLCIDGGIEKWDSMSFAAREDHRTGGRNRGGGQGKIRADSQIHAQTQAAADFGAPAEADSLSR